MIYHYHLGNTTVAKLGTRQSSGSTTRSTVQSYQVSGNNGAARGYEHGRLSADKLAVKLNSGYVKANKQALANRDLPQTGERQNNTAALLGSGLLVGLLSLFGLKRKKRQN